MDQTDTTKRSRRGPGRMGGRAARQALRAAPLADDIRPVRAGLEGGTYNPFSDADMQRIHATALDALEQIGLADAPPSGVEIRTLAGARLGDDRRLPSPPPPAYVRSRRGGRAAGLGPFHRVGGRALGVGDLDQGKVVFLIFPKQGVFCITACQHY